MTYTIGTDGERQNDGNEPGGSTPEWPPALVEFVRQFNKKWYWSSHEVLETPWLVNRSDFYQGLIIYASAFVHALRGNPVGVGKQLAKVPGKLTKYGPHYMGVDVEAILRHCNTCIAIVSGSHPPRGAALKAAIPFPTLTLDPNLVLGGEPEFTDASARST